MSARRDIAAAARTLLPSRLAMLVAGAVLAVAITVWVAAAMRLEAQTPMRADLSEHLVAITTGFAGTDVLLFGSIDEPGHVIVVVRGPRQDVTMYRKTRVAGIWINTASMTFEQATSFYAIAASAPLMDVTTETLRRRHALGMQQALPTLPSAKASQNVAEEWQQAFLRNKQRKGLYPREVSQVRFLGNKLFRTNIFFPANVPTGSYTVDTFLVRDGRVISAQTTPLIISKLGLEADIFEFAHDFSAFYGLVAVFLALVAGWIAHVVFRRN